MQDEKRNLALEPFMTTSLAIVNENSPLLVAQAETDEHLVVLWLHGRSRHTQRSYAFGWRLLKQHVQKPLRSMTLGDLQGFADALATGSISESTRNRRLSAVKSLFSFAHRLGYLPFDIGRPLRLPKFRETLCERILSEDEVHRMLATDRNPRNSVMLELLYVAGVRVSELCGLRRQDLQERPDGGQITVYGKGR
jgi:integrase/recombinase XerD